MLVSRRPTVGEVFGSDCLKKKNPKEKERLKVRVAAPIVLQGSAPSKKEGSLAKSTGKGRRKPVLVFWDAITGRKLRITYLEEQRSM